MPNDLADNRANSDLSNLRIPAHIGVIMDGNGRWAKQRGKARTEGHRVGIQTLKRMVSWCGEAGVDYLTVFSFSAENWNRPRSEIEFIFNLLHRFVDGDLQDLVRNNVRVRILGERAGLDNSILNTISRVETATQANDGLKLNVAFNYGGKQELLHAVKSLAHDVAAGRLKPDEINDAAIEQNLYTANMPAPDLILRTGGEQRISNFLIWQAAYAELVFLDTYWPDFSKSDFLAALELYSKRERRFGGLSEKEMGEASQS